MTTGRKSDVNQQLSLDAPEMLSAVLDTTMNAMIFIDDKGTIELFNPAAERMFGYQSDEVLGKNVKMLMPEQHQLKHDEYLSNYFRNKDPIIPGSRRESTGIKKNGKIFPVELSLGEVSNSSHKQFVGIIRDISEQVAAIKEAVENRERLAYVTRLSTMVEMAAGIAHELNQPLTAIATYAHACSRLINNSIASKQTDTLNRKLLISFDKISNQAMRAGDVIRKLRALVKKRAAIRELTNLNNMIKDTVVLAQIDPRMQQHEIRLDLTHTPKPELMIDVVQLQQLLLNLIRNAIDATEQQPGTPIIIASKWLSDNSLMVSVMDTGQGVEKQHLATLFNPFFTTKESGMGMGLSICKSIIQSHGGDLWHTANSPRGSIFSFTLPLKLFIDKIPISNGQDNGQE